jgi:hypothetical protein
MRSARNGKPSGRLHRECIPAQSRPASFAEALANVIAGYVVAIVVQAIVYPLFGIETNLSTDGIIALVFTATSLLRAYALRRFFLRIEHHRSRQEKARLASLERRLSTGRP